jgi:hypothetical protein
MRKSLHLLIWLFVALLGGWAYYHLATTRHEPLNSAYIVTAALCTYTIGYRFYSKWVAARVLMLNDRRALAVYRMVIAEAGRSEVGELFHETGPRQCMEALTRFMAATIERGAMRKTDPTMAAVQFMALLTAETGVRLYQQNPPRIAAAEIQQRVTRAVDFFLLGVAPAA